MNIKSCPFCGNNKIEVYNPFGDESFCVICRICGAHGPTVIKDIKFYDHPDAKSFDTLVIEKWNERVFI